MDGMLPIRNGIYTDGWLEFTVWTFQPTKWPWTWLFLAIGCVTFGRFFFSKTKTIWTWVWLISSCGLLKVGYEKKPVPTEVLFLLPHEVLNAVYEAGPMQAVVFKTHGSVWALFFFTGNIVSEYQSFPKTFASNPAVCNFYDWTPKHKKHCWVLVPC